ncbi:MAG: rimK 3 [Gammaproteobacteria bacterium]|jgi:ribosomal protein S6--L-glutamate ligase|nr:rimK 3 [Gammaproteobacteria bacterium]
MYGADTKDKEGKHIMSKRAPNISMRKKTDVVQPPVEKMVIGWSEWCALPDLKIPAIKAKIDTGAKTSAIHAFDIEQKRKNNKDWVFFSVYPLQRSKAIAVRCAAEAVDKRYVMSSSGHKEYRFVIFTSVVLGEQQWEIEMTLSNRDPLSFRMLLGREALNANLYVDPIQSLKHGKLSKARLNSFYNLK